MTRLFGDFPKALATFTLPQINQGVWVMFGSNFECQRYLFDPSVPLEKRLGCIRAMFCVYADFVAGSDVPEMESCFDMWWHCTLRLDCALLKVPHEMARTPALGRLECDVRWLLSVE